MLNGPIRGLVVVRGPSERPESRTPPKTGRPNPGDRNRPVQDRCVTCLEGVEPKVNAAELIEEIKKMSVLELSELVKALEEEFGVSAAMPMAMAAAGGRRRRRG